MLLRNEIKNASDVELLTAILGNKVTAEVLLKKAGGSLYALLYGLPQQNGDLFCAEGSTCYQRDPIAKLQAASELAARAITEELRGRSCLTSPGAVRDLLKHKLA